MLCFRDVNGYPVLFARASLKQWEDVYGKGIKSMSYPVLFARASLKPPVGFAPAPLDSMLSRAFCAGLIEAPRRSANWKLFRSVIPCFLRGPH